MQRSFFKRKTEAWLLLLTAIITLAAVVSLELAQGNELTSGVFMLVGGFFIIFLVAHLVLNWIAPDSDQILLPVAALLNGLGLVMIYRIDLATGMSLAKSQVMWMVVGVGLLIAVLVFLRDHRSLQDYAYLMGLIGLLLLALPIVWPTTLNADSNVWISIGPFSIQPGEFAKILLLVFFAALLVNKRRLFSVTGKSVLGMQFPRMRDMGPLLLVWGLALVISAAQNDFGPALLLFATVLGMLYMVTSRASWVVLGVGLAAIGSYGVYQVSTKIQTRVANFIDPFEDFHGRGLQLAQSLFGLSYGGLTGKGLGEGYPELIPVVHSDFILSAFGEELGLIGLTAILLMYTIFVMRGYTVAMHASDSFGKLVAAGLALTVAVQVFVVVGGISKLMPMTGLTTPFLAHGGSSLLANYILLAILLRISDSARAQRAVKSSGAAQDSGAEQGSDAALGSGAAQSSGNAPSAQGQDAHPAAPNTSLHQAIRPEGDRR